MIHDSRKIAAMKQRQKNFITGVTTTWGTVLKGCSTSKVEDCCSKIISFEKIPEIRPFALDILETVLELFSFFLI